MYSHKNNKWPKAVPIDGLALQREADAKAVKAGHDPILCQKCGGFGLKGKKKCETCAGTGKHRKTKEL